MYEESAEANPDGKSRKKKNDVMYQKRMSENIALCPILTTNLAACVCVCVCVCVCKM